MKRQSIPKPPVGRLSMEIGPKTREKLERLSNETEQSFSETIRNALGLYDILWSEVQAGHHLIVRDADGKGEREIVIPKLGY